MAVKAVVFDLGKVICPFEHDNICIGLSAFSPLTSGDIYQEIFDSGLERQFDEGTLKNSDFYRLANDLIQSSLTLEEFKSIWNDIFSLDPEVVKIVRELKDCKRYLLSNTNEWHFAHLMESFEVLREFDGYALSFEVGSAKPKPAIWQHVLDISGMMAQECVYIDDIKSYVEAAANLGFQAIHFTGADALARELEKIRV